MKQANPNWMVTVQAPQTLVNPFDGVQAHIPGYVQIDDIEDGQNNWSKTTNRLHDEGYEIPDFHLLPQGKYTWAQATILVGWAQAAAAFNEYEALKAVAEAAKIRHEGRHDSIDNWHKVNDALAALAKVREGKTTI